MVAKAKGMSVKRIVIFVSLASMVLTIGVVGYIVFLSWHLSARETTESITNNISSSIQTRLTNFMHAPYHVNEVNHFHLESESFDLEDEYQRDRFFVGVLKAHEDSIYSFSFGSSEGDYYGARRNDEGVIEIMRNNQTTGGESWYYQVNVDYSAGERVLQAGEFNPRTRDWYIAAAELGKPTFSSVYKHFVMEDLTISASWPIYDPDGMLMGVMGTHMLLGDMGAFLREAVEDFKGYAFIVERETGQMIANSMGVDNFFLEGDGTFRLKDVSEVGISGIQGVYEYYLENGAFQSRFDSNGENLFVSGQEMTMEGIEWLVISAVPESLLMSTVNQSIRWTVLSVILALAIIAVLFHFIIKWLFRPVDVLVDAAEKLTQGDLRQRVDIKMQNEIGRLSRSFNMVAGRMEHLINNLEAEVSERTRELDMANQDLRDNKDQLQLILDTSAEAIFGLDLQGRCTFCNRSSLRILGYDSQEELIGVDIHKRIHHSHLDGSEFSLDDCRIRESVMLGVGMSSEDEVFWRKDGRPVYVEYHSYPQIVDGEVIGAVVTFMDITERKEKEDRISYLTYHDHLTGLRNRAGFETIKLEVDTKENLPLAVIFADINGLKLTNDIFGHGAGDSLIKESAEVLMKSCRDEDIIARIGGDEFVILLPMTGKDETEKVVTRIRKNIERAAVETIRCSVSMGYDIKTEANMTLREVMANAEDHMYKEKTLNRREVNRGMITNILQNLYKNNPREKRHSVQVAKIAEDIGMAMGLAESEVSRLRNAAYLHDIGKITVDKEILSKDRILDEEREEIRQHSVVGYRLLNMFDETVDLAEYIYSHHERWDGTGYPRGLKEEEIPLLSRIISVAEVYERILNREGQPESVRRKKASEVIEQGAGTQFDPEIVKVFLEMERDGEQ